MEIRQNVIDDLNAMTTESWRTIASWPKWSRPWIR